MKVTLAQTFCRRAVARDRDGCASTCLDNAHDAVSGAVAAAGTAAVRKQEGVRAFSLMEVMIAIALFFMASFVILALVSSGLRTARMLRTTRPNAGMLAAEMTLTNQLEEGVESGDFGNMYREYTWTKETSEAGTNGLWQVDFAIFRRGQGQVPDSTMSILVYSPNSKSKRLGVQPP